MSDRIDQAVALLVEAHASGVRTLLPTDLTEAEAREVQIEVIRRRGSIGAWKIGLVSGVMRAAPIAIAAVASTGHHYPAITFGMRGLETEVALRLGRAFLAGGDPPTDRDIVDAIIEVRYAIEILDSRLSNWRNASTEHTLADGLNNAGLVLGAAISDWRRQNLAQPGATLFVDGNLRGRAEGNGSGDPVVLTVTLVRHCHTHGLDILAGTWITTGSSTGCTFVNEGANAIVRVNDEDVVGVAFGGIGGTR
ncbi:hypothetical protein K9B33_16430 [Sphingobium sp. 3R8]|uniref:hypothetical protein n=1 Tax=Sphingobium sp. 3R8 TaxID=2874921 RepID=UPI001CCE9580|nr:hypothetical protein [Sphingobium sp. 3R8]MBZ9649127.1 hypothetical protein [Sphingobium sp. 3R8]